MKDFIKAFFNGVARIGTLQPKHEVQPLPNPWESVGRDFAQTGRDMWQAIEDIEREIKNRKSYP